MSWEFPLKNWKKTIPWGNHPGSFGAVRKHDIHTGVDLYARKFEPVFAVEDGEIISIEDFTGPNAESPWWQDTKAILIKGKTGVVCYGEVLPTINDIRKQIVRGQKIAEVVPVLDKDKIRTDIPGHSNCMLHFELYKHDAKNTVWWHKGEEKPKYLLDPTPYLANAIEIRNKIY